MIKMEKQMAEDGRASLGHVIDWLEESGKVDPTLDANVRAILRNNLRDATSEQMEIIIAWCYVGAMSDHMMHRMEANEQAKKAVEMMMMNSAGPGLKGGA